MQAYSRREEHRALRAERKAGEPEAGGEEHQVEPAELDREDDVLLLLLHGLMVGPLTNRRKKPLRTQHLMIDEAQDFSAVFYPAPNDSTFALRLTQSDTLLFRIDKFSGADVLATFVLPGASEVVPLVIGACS